MFTVKLQHDSDIRRFKMGDIIFDSLLTKVSEVCALPTDSVVLKYKDDEGDLVTVTCDDELEEAVQMQSGNVLRLIVSSQPSSPAAPTPAPAPAPVKAAVKAAMPAPAPAKAADIPAAKRVPNATNAHAAPAASTAPPAASNKDSKNSAHEGAPPSTEESAPPLPSPEEILHEASAAFEPFMKEAAEKLPEVVNQLQKNMPGIAETLSHLLGGIAVEAATTESSAAAAAVHWGVTCDKSGMSPIVGIRYKKKQDNYDLCQAEFDKLPEAEKAQYLAIERPHPYYAAFNCGVPANRRGEAAPHPSSAAQAHKVQPAVHWGITCDKSGQSPIVGPRFKMVGRDYDLNETEFNKLPASERSQFERIDFPRHCPWRQRTPASSRAVEPPLQARFVRDVTIFDGTEMAPGTPFTKIWTVRNDGANEWPEDVKLQCVGGDDLQAPHRVKLQHHGKVALGSEVQLAVDLVAPQRAGRYIAYFRLITPSGKKFGQRIWCTLNVVENDDLNEQHSALDDNKPIDAATPAAVGAAPVAPKTGADAPTTESAAAAAATPGPSKPPPAFEHIAGTLSPVPDATKTPRSGVVVAAAVDRTPEVAAPAAAPVTPVRAPSTEVAGDAVTHEDNDSVYSDTVVISTEEQVLASLEAMGFTDAELNAAVIDREHAKLEACAGTLLALSDWSKELNDLTVMGFLDRRRNIDLMLKHNGDIRLTVKELISA